VVFFAGMLFGVMCVAAVFATIATQLTSVKTNFAVFRQKMDLIQVRI
jgi:hypothetical protein